MTLHELAQAVAAGRILGFEVISLEGGFYVLQARLAEGLRPVRDDSGQVLHLRSTTQVREVLGEWASLPCELVEPLRVPLSLEPRA
jgi:hypothetical protein